MDSHHVCPVCNKSYKHLIAHLKNKHNWEVEDIFNFQNTKDDESDGKDVARKVSEKEVEAESTVGRLVDKAIMMNALLKLDGAISDVYTGIEVDMRNTAMEAGKIYRRLGRDEVDGPRTDITRRVREILQPSSQYLRECILHELSRIRDELKINIIEML